MLGKKVIRRVSGVSWASIAVRCYNSHFVVAFNEEG